METMKFTKQPLKIQYTATLEMFLKYLLYVANSNASNWWQSQGKSVFM